MANFHHCSKNELAPMAAVKNKQLKSLRLKFYCGFQNFAFWGSNHIGARESFGDSCAGLTNESAPRDFPRRTFPKLKNFWNWTKIYVFKTKMKLNNKLKWFFPCCRSLKSDKRNKKIFIFKNMYFFIVYLVLRKN